MNYKIFWSLLFAIILMGLLCLRPVPYPNANNTYEKNVLVKKIFEGPSYDVVFKIDHSNSIKYINRGIQHYDINVEDWNEKLQNKEVKMTLIKHWSPLTWGDSDRSIAKIETIEGEVIFDRFDS